MANNTGIFFNINDNDGIPLVGVSTEGRVLIDPFYGNVGIGTTNPSSKLHIKGNTTIDGSLTVSGTLGGSLNLLSSLGNYVWSSSTLPASYNQGIQCSFVSGAQSFQNYGSVMTMNTYSGGGGALQLYVPYSPTYGGTGLQVRFGNYDVSSGNSWTSWKTLLASDNVSSYAVSSLATSGSGISVNSSTGSVTISSNATSSNTASTIVARDSSGNFSAGNITASNFADSTGSYNVNLGSGGTEGRGLVAGYSGGSYGGIGYNVRHTNTGGTWIAPTTDTSSYLLFNQGFTFYNAASGAAGRTLSYSALANLNSSGTLTLNNVQLNSSGYIGLNGGTTYGLGVLSSNRNSAVFDTIEATGSDSLELNYYQGGSVKIGSGVYGSKSLYAVGIYDNGNLCLNSSNYSSYALPLSGGTLSGALTISGNSLTATNIYNNAWFRNQNSGEGLYNTATTNHWYSSSGAYWDTSCGGNASGGIRIRQGYESTINGYVYFDSSGFGLLDSGGSWSYRTTTSAAEIYKTLYTRAIDVQNNTISSTGPIRPYGVGGNSSWTRSSYPYEFGFQETGVWTNPYPDLVLQYHTGVTMAANSSYGGIRFKADHNDETLIFQVNGSSNYIFKYNWMNTDTTGFYSSTNGAHLYPNTGSSYGQWRIDGSRNSYGGIWDYYSGVNGIMYDSSGNGGIYREATGRWYLYHNVADTCMGVNTSSTSSSYGLYVSGGIYSTGNVVAYSDERKKTDIQTITSALDKVNKLRGVTYKRIDYKKDDVGYDNIEMGVIAQEVQEIVPEVVTHAKDIDEYGVSYGNFAGLFIEAIKEQTAIINNLKTEIENLKSKLGE